VRAAATPDWTAYRLENEVDQQGDPDAEQQNWPKSDQMARAGIA
jgi:hypothetical protein